MKDRLTPCIHYLNEGNCALGKAGTFNRQCQICKTYKKDKKAAAKPNVRRAKMERIVKREGSSVFE